MGMQSNELVDIVAGIAGKRIRKAYDLTKPQGVRGRNSDNSRLRSVLAWEPSVSLEDGLKATYDWIHEQIGRAGCRVHICRRHHLKLFRLCARIRRDQHVRQLS
jgi:hypothetical protein